MLPVSKRNPKASRLVRIDIEPMSLVFILGLLATFVAPRWMRGPSSVAYDGLVVACFGLLCLVIAKVSLFRRGIWFSWGPRRMSKWPARVYKCGYAFLVLGVGVTLIAYGAIRSAEHRHAVDAQKDARGSSASRSASAGRSG